jgi:hypothetical protein
MAEFIAKNQAKGHLTLSSLPRFFRKNFAGNPTVTSGFIGHTNGIPQQDRMGNTCCHNGSQTVRILYLIPPWGRRRALLQHTDQGPSFGPALLLVGQQYAHGPKQNQGTIDG